MRKLLTPPNARVAARCFISDARVDVRGMPEVIGAGSYDGVARQPVVGGHLQHIAPRPLEIADEDPHRDGADTETRLAGRPQGVLVEVVGNQRIVIHR